MPTKTQTQSTGARQPQATDQQNQKQGQRLPSMKATVNWMNPNDEDNIRATASMTVGGAFAVHGIKVIRSEQKGDFVSMPSYKSKDGYKDIFHAVTAEAREQMNSTVMAAYEQKLADQTQSESPSEDDLNEAPADEPVQAEKGQGMAM